MHPLLKRFATFFFGSYRLVRVYTKNLDTQAQAASEKYDIRALDWPEQFNASDDQRLRDHGLFAGEDAMGFGLWEGELLVCECVFWTHVRFRDSALGPVASDVAVLVDMLTAERARGRGYAHAVLRHAEAALGRAGYRRVMGQVWHSNLASIRTFDKAGWEYSHFVVELFPFRREKPWRCRIPRRRP